jgi:hypothetical protein
MSKFTIGEPISKLIITSNKIKDNSQIFKTLKELVDNNSFNKKDNMIQFIIDDSNPLYQDFNKPTDCVIISDVNSKPFDKLDKKLIDHVIDGTITQKYINTLNYDTAMEKINNRKTNTELQTHKDDKKDDNKDDKKDDKK